jgi:hypothetical protein
VEKKELWGLEPGGLDAHRLSERSEGGEHPDPEDDRQEKEAHRSSSPRQPEHLTGERRIDGSGKSRGPQAAPLREKVEKQGSSSSQN